MSGFDEIEKLWLEFHNLPFPSELVTEDVKGVCIISLDTFTAGCIDTFISRKGHLDKKRKSTLNECQKELEIVIENLEGQAKTYFEKLSYLVSKILHFLNL